MSAPMALLSLKGKLAVIVRTFSPSFKSISFAAVKCPVNCSY